MPGLRPDQRAPLPLALGVWAGPVPGRRALHACSSFWGTPLPTSTSGIRLDVHLALFSENSISPASSPRLPSCLPNSPAPHGIVSPVNEGPHQGLGPVVDEAWDHGVNFMPVDHGDKEQILTPGSLSCWLGLISSSALIMGQDCNALLSLGKPAPSSTRRSP